MTDASSSIPVGPRGQQPAPAGDTALTPVATIERRKPDKADWQRVPIVMVALLALTVGVLWVYFLIRAGDSQQPLSQLEQMFFGTYTLLVGALVSWLVSAYYARHQARDSFQQLARPALRRVLAARDSAQGLLSAIERRRILYENGPSVGAIESLNSLTELIEQHARVLDDAVSDWREVLPEDVRAAESSEDVRRRLGVVENTMAARMADMTAQLDNLANRQAGANPEDLAGEVAVLKSQFQRIRREYDNLARELRRQLARVATMPSDKDDDADSVVDLTAALRRSVEEARRSRSGI